MKWIIMLAAILFFIPSLVSAENHYVTQNGGSGSMSVGDFNNPGNWNSAVNSDDGYIGPGDTVYFSGMITSEIAPQGSGTPGNYITLDGYASGECDAISESCPGQAVITLSQDIGQTGFALWDSSYGRGNGRDYIIIQDFEITEVNDGIYGAEDCDHIIIRRNYIHDTLSHGISLTTHWICPCTGNNHITIGGALGEGNVIKNAGVGTGSADITLSSSHDIIVSYNHLYATPDKAIGAPTDRGIDGIVPIHDTYNVLIEYNSIHSHNDNYYPDPTGQDISGLKGRGEDGIDIKDDSGTLPGCHDIIVRYNHIYDHKYQSNIHPQTLTNHLYIYGNRLHDSNWGGVYMKEGGSVSNPMPEPVSYIYIFSNIIYNERDAGSRVHGTEGGTTDKCHHIYWFNNVFAENGIDIATYGNTFTHIQADMNPDSSYIKNNVFYKSRPSYTSYQERQVYLYDDVTECDYNYYYWPGKTSQVCINSICASAIGGFSGIETYGLEGDPGLIDLENNNFRVSVSDSAVVDTGTVTGTGNIAVVTIQGVDYPVRWDAALHPSTDWSTTPPTVITANQSDHGSGWERGAYVYVDGEVPDTCESLGGYCCILPDTCPGADLGTFTDCSGTCCDQECQAPPEDTCTDLGYFCCTECVPDTEHPENDSDCSPQVCCGTCLSQPIQGDYNYSIIKTPYPPVIDGDLSEFSDADTTMISDSVTGNSGTYRLMWDDDALYISAVISDTKLNAVVTENDTSQWGDDTFEIMFDTENDKGSSIQQDDYKFFVNPLETYADSEAFNRGWNTRVDYAVSVDGTFNNNGDTDTSYIVEMAIPWQEWGITAPGFRTEWGMNIMLNDYDGQDINWKEWNVVQDLGVNVPDGWGDVLFTVRADTSRDGCVHMNELVPFIDSWKYDSTTYPMREMMEAVTLYYSPGAWCS